MSTPTPTIEPPKAGTTVYDLYGNVGQVNTALPNGAILVGIMFEGIDHDSRGSERTVDFEGPLQIWHKWFTAPPKAKKAEEVAELDRQVDELRDKLHALRAEESQARRTAGDRMRFLKQHEKLQRLDDFLSGKFTHMVVWGWYDLKVLKIEDFMKERDGMRLLTLYGNTKGELNWRLGEYSDHSGSDFSCVPCFSYEEAISEVQRIAEERFTELRTSTDPNFRTDKCRRAIEAYQKYNLTPPQDILDILATEQERNIRRQQEDKQKEIRDLEAKLNALKSQTPTAEEG